MGMNKSQERFANFARTVLSKSPTTAHELSAMYGDVGYVAPTTMQTVSILKRMHDAYIQEPRNVGRSAVWSVREEVSSREVVGSSNDEPSKTLHR